MSRSEESESQSQSKFVIPPLDKAFEALSVSSPHHRSSTPSPSRRRRKQRFRNKHRKDFISLLLDELLEMCLVRLPIPTLLTARQVSKKWRHLTTTPYFLQMKRQASHHHPVPWFFLFGATTLDNYKPPHIYTCDVSQGQWYKIDAGYLLRERYNFSVAGIQDRIYIVGGRTYFGNLYRPSFKTHKGVILYTPLTNSCCKVAPMKYARTRPTLGTCEVTWDACRKNAPIFDTKFGCKKFVLIAVGGTGSRGETLSSGEMYDCESNKWTEIQRLPADMGFIRCGVVCKGIFYIYSETKMLAGYDIQNGFWTEIQTNHPPRVNHNASPKLVSCNDRLLMFFMIECDERDYMIGIWNNKNFRKLWELDFLSLTWTEVSAHSEDQRDPCAAFVADRNIIFGIEMFREENGRVSDFLLSICHDVSSDKGMRWSRVSRNHLTSEFSSNFIIKKSIAVLHL